MFDASPRKISRQCRFIQINLDRPGFAKAPMTSTIDNNPPENAAFFSCHKTQTADHAQTKSQRQHNIHKTKTKQTSVSAPNLKSAVTSTTAGSHHYAEPPHLQLIRCAPAGAAPCLGGVSPVTSAQRSEGWTREGADAGQRDRGREGRVFTALLSRPLTVSCRGLARRSARIARASERVVNGPGDRHDHR